MASKTNWDKSSPASSTIEQGHSRRPSQPSPSPGPELDKETLSAALDHMHTNASKSHALTTFDDFTSPRPGNKAELKGFAGDIVQSGLSGLYSRIKASVGAAKDAVAGTGGNETPDDASVTSGKARSVGHTSSGTGAIASPITPSAVSSRLQSPLTAKFPESQASGAHPPPLSGQSRPPIATVATTLVTPRQASSARPLNDEEKAEQAMSRHNDLHMLSPDSRTALALSHLATSFSSPTIKSHRNIGTPEAPVGLEEYDASGLRNTLSPYQPRASHQPLDIRPEGFAMQRQDSDIGSNYTDLSTVSMDLERTPRKVAKTEGTAKRIEPSALDGTRSPIKVSAAKDGPPSATAASIPANLNSFNTSEEALQRPTLVQVSQSHLPGFRASRANSSDGDLSSVAGNFAQSRPSHFDAVEEQDVAHVARLERHPNSNVTRMKSKILAKELWMRDENAKDCFYCGDAFSAFRRKHHCRKYKSNPHHVL